MKLNKKLAVFLLAATSSLTILSTTAATSGGSGSGCIAQCQQELSNCLSDGHSPKQICLREYRECKNNC